MHRSRILVAEDDEATAHLLGALLRREWDVMVTTNLNKLNEIAARELPFDVVLEDLPDTYPHLEGPEGVAIELSPNDALFREPWAGATRVVIGRDSTQLAKAASIFNCEYLVKPVVVEKLNERLRVARDRAIVYRHKQPQQSVVALGAHIAEVSDELLKYLSDHPDLLRQLHWRKFEQVVARLLERSGFRTSLQRGAKDGGIDIIAADHVDFGSILMLVQCKQTTRHVGVELVRELYGVTQQRRATIGVLATTSYFTRDALEFQRPISATLELRDFDEIAKWLRKKIK